MRFDPFHAVDCRHGAQMGRAGNAPHEWDARKHGRQLFARPAQGDGYYDKGGAYWGASREGGVFAVFTRGGKFCTYIRAKSKEAARKTVWFAAFLDYPEAA
jgi:hypothetical protein